MLWLDVGICNRPTVRGRESELVILFLLFLLQKTKASVKLRRCWLWSDLGRLSRAFVTITDALYRVYRLCRLSQQYSEAYSSCHWQLDNAYSVAGSLVAGEVACSKYKYVSRGDRAHHQHADNDTSCSTNGVHIVCTVCCRVWRHWSIWCDF